MSTLGPWQKLGRRRSERFQAKTCVLQLGKNVYYNEQNPHKNVRATP